MSSKKSSSQSEEFGKIVAQAALTAVAGSSQRLTRNSDRPSTCTTWNSNKNVGTPPDQPRPTKIARHDLFGDDDAVAAENPQAPSPPTATTDDPPAPPHLQLMVQLHVGRTIGTLVRTTSKRGS